jgi:hypothetical protein
MRNAIAGRRAVMAAVAWLPIFGATVSMPAPAQELSLLSGANQSGSHSSYEWQLEFREPLVTYAAASLGWINEGHLQQHRRDGVTGELWLDVPWLERLRFDLGMGPYMYFDTLPDINSHGYSDHHGVGLVASAGVTLKTARHWHLQLRFNDIVTPGDINIQSIQFGVTYDFEHLLERVLPQSGDVASTPTLDLGRQELQLFAGRSTLNSLDVRNWWTYGLDYQYSLRPWFSAAVTGFVDSGTHAPRDRLGVQGRFTYRFDESPLLVTAGVGAYTTLLNTGSREPFEGLLLLRAEWLLTRHLSVDASWYRSFTEDDRDLDIITAGVAWRFGSF